ncbi:MAG: hypothetical protein ACRENE_32835 [Polyangiaceae bacterium]
MDISKLFQVLVVTGASTTVGLAACSSSSSGGGGSEDGGGSSGASGSSSSGGSSSSSSSSGGSTSSSSSGAAATGADGEACSAVCHPSATLASWTDCNGCCCWLPIGTTAPAGSPTCGDEPCCIGRGRM